MKLKLKPETLAAAQLGSKCYQFWFLGQFDTKMLKAYNSAPRGQMEYDIWYNENNKNWCQTVLQSNVGESIEEIVALCQSCQVVHSPST